MVLGGLPSVNLIQCERKRSWSISVQYHRMCKLRSRNTTEKCPTRRCTCPGRPRTLNANRYRPSQASGRARWKLRLSETAAVGLRALLSRSSTGETRIWARMSASPVELAQSGRKPYSVTAISKQLFAGVRCSIRLSYMALEYNRLPFRENGTLNCLITWACGHLPQHFDTP
jgi:hypothetical protein